MGTLKKVKTEVAEEIRTLRQEARERTMGYVTGAFGVIAGLAWNDFVKGLIEYVFPLDKTSMFAKLIYAVVMTAIVVGVATYLSRALKNGEKSNPQQS